MGKYAKINVKVHWKECYLWKTAYKETFQNPNITFVGLFGKFGSWINPDASHQAISEEAMLNNGEKI